MKFTELVLHNFGIYKGRHIVDLRTKGSKRPIILLGGLNGGGKTTILDALQLALYGKHAKCASTNDLSYQDYLKDMINNHVDPKEGAALELEFSYFNDGQEETYRLKRYWKYTGKHTRERMEVLNNGILDTVMSEQWYEYVDEFIPINISQLFFFDGEKIENLASPKNSAGIIKTGIKTLLGLDLVDKLQSDLKIIEKRKLTKTKNDKDNVKISAYDEEINELNKNISDAKQQLANKRSEIDSLQRQIIDAKNDYRNHGGELHDKRELLVAQYQYAKERIANIESQLRQESEGSMPLLLVEKLIHKTQKTSIAEHKIIANRELLSVLEDRDRTILDNFTGNRISDQHIDALTEILQRDRNDREIVAKKEIQLNVKPDRFKPFDKSYFKQLHKTAQKLLKEFTRANEELLDCEKQKVAIPDEASIQEIATLLNSKEVLLNKTISEKMFLTNNLSQLEKQLSSKQINLDRALHKRHGESLDNEKETRILNHSMEVRDTLDKYRQLLVDKHITKLQSLIMESFSSLLQKSDLVGDIRIEPSSYSLHVYDKSGELIPAKQLSAGERQILAIAILWGLAKASGRPLPAIIDTPLGRLDSNHRGKLVNNYFPNASHQVILLSTDTEIDQQYRDALKNRIGKEYHIQYQESIKTSTITAGYF